MKLLLLLALVLIIASLSAMAQSDVNRTYLPIQKDIQRKNLVLPTIENFVTLKGDFHMHTVFSDGKLWPTLRVEEAWAEGLDVISITDHLEYQPHKKYLNADHNASYKIAKKVAAKYGILMVKGTEITRAMPPGHLNAFFIEDANKLASQSVDSTFMELESQNGFMIWNHPGWDSQQPDTTMLFQIHEELIKSGRIKGMEVMNHSEWYPIVLKWCLENNLAVFANSDVHGVNGYVYDLERSHRPMTLLFAKEKSIAGVKEAIESARTVAWFDQQLAGPEKLIQALYDASVEVRLNPFIEKDKFQYFELKNSSDLQFSFETDTDQWGSPKKFTLQAQKTMLVRVRKGVKQLHCTLSNCHVGMKQNLKVVLE